MSNIRWKPMPDQPGYEINRSGWVRNERGYVVASGRGAYLFVGGGRLYLGRQRLLAIAAELFGMPAPEPKKAGPRTPTPSLQGEPSPAPELAAELPQDKVPEQPPAMLNERLQSVSYTTRDRERDWLNPERTLPLRDPWADGSIETHTEWDWAGVR
jgi:hypothetical protein